ncbi:MAG: hypothetical protein FJ284_11395, partial [Planctomycetes bacterium]|nr:hypothetical protein [Planctomycetota bacterium]
EPATGWSIAIPYREVNTETTQAFLDAAASRLRRRKHAVMILDGAGWHCSHKLRWPRRITPLFLPPYSPELNPVERQDIRSICRIRWGHACGSSVIHIRWTAGRSTGPAGETCSHYAPLQLIAARLVGVSAPHDKPDHS